MTGRRACPATILFVKMRDTGKAMPIDPQPDERGNIAALRTGRNTYTDGHYLNLDQPLAQGEVRMMQHWYTCADPTKPGKPQPRPTETQPALDNL